MLRVAPAAAPPRRPRPDPPSPGIPNIGSGRTRGQSVTDSLGASGNADLPAPRPARHTGTERHRPAGTPARIPSRCTRRLRQKGEDKGEGARGRGREGRGALFARARQGHGSRNRYPLPPQEGRLRSAPGRVCSPGPRGRPESSAPAIPGPRPFGEGPGAADRGRHSLIAEARGPAQRPTDATRDAGLYPSRPFSPSLCPSR